MPQILRKRPWLPILAVWGCAAAPLAVLDHYALRSNAFDLSVFDYALWSTVTGRSPGHVPFLGHSLGAHHFMPTLALLAPLYALAPTPVLLILVQLAAAAATALLLARLSAERVPPAVTAGLVASFLFARPSYNAIMSVFYVEALIPPLVFAMVLAVRARAYRAYWIAAVLALGCKEDVGLYLASFGVLLAVRREHRRVGLATVAVALAWVALAVGYAIPAARAADGLPETNPFASARYGGPAGTAIEDAVTARLFDRRPFVKLFNVLASQGLLSLFAPADLAVAVPGIVLNLAAGREHLQSALVGHYLWPILPWLFLASIEGARRLIARFGRRARVLVPVVLFGAALGDTPLWLDWARRPWHGLAEGAAVRAQLAGLPSVPTVLVQPNLIPHLSHRDGVVALGREVPSTPPELVVMCHCGALWPFDQTTLAPRIREIARDPALEQVPGRGPLLVYRRSDPGR